MTKHVFLPTTLNSDKGTALMSHVIKEVTGVLGITLKHATTKHTQTIGLLEQSQASIKQALKIETGERRSLWYKYVKFAVLNCNTSYHTRFGCEASRVFHGRILYIFFGFKSLNSPIATAHSTSRIAQDVLDQTEMIHQDVRKKAMQAYIKYGAYYDKKANASKLREADHLYVLQLKADHQGSKNPFTEFRWIGLYIIEKVLPNNNCLVRKNSTNKTQVLHRMRICQFTPRQPPADIRIVPQGVKPDTDVSLKHDDLYARAWEYDYEQPVFDAENNNATTPNAHEIPVQPAFSIEEMRNTPGTAYECSPEVFPQTEEVSDVTDTYPNIEPDAEGSSEQAESSPTNPCSSKYNLVINPSLIAMTTTDFELSAGLECSTEHARKRSRNLRNVLRSTYVQHKFLVIFWYGYFLATNSLAIQSGLLQNRAFKTKFSNTVFLYTCRIQFIYFFSFS